MTQRLVIVYLSRIPLGVKGNNLSDNRRKREMPPPPSPLSSPSSSSSSSSSSMKKKKNSLIKLDVKFDLPIYDGEINVEKLSNWIRQIDVYFRVQDVDSKRKNIQLASLRL